MDQDKIFQKLRLSIRFQSSEIKRKRRQKSLSNGNALDAGLVGPGGPGAPTENRRKDDAPPPEKRQRSASCSSDGAIDLLTGMSGAALEGAEKKRKKKKRKGTKTEEENLEARKEEEINAFRNAHRIHVKGSDVAEPLRTFEDFRRRLGLGEVLSRNIEGLGFVEPTPIQMQAVPVMASGRPILACAPTGSGKTLAFAIPILHSLKGSKTGVGFRAVVLSPTRELSQQTYRVFHRLAEGTGIKIFNVDSRVEKAAEKFAPDNPKGVRFDILITTPSRLVALLRRRPKPGVDLKNVEWLVVDESDKLFEEGGQDGGFRSQLASVYKACRNPKIRHAMFSATYQSNVEEWCRTHLDNVVEVVVGVKNASVKEIEQKVKFVGSKEGKILAIKEMIREGVKPPVLVFTESQESAQQLYNELVYDALNVDVIHGGRTQLQREESIKKLRLGTTWILVCTELLGRGMDFQGVNLVINYDFPRSAISYVHRIGRTGRAGRPGQAVTFFTEDDTYYLRSIAGVMRDSGCLVPDHLLTLTEKRKEIGKMSRLRIARIKEGRPKKKKKI